MTQDSINSILPLMTSAVHAFLPAVLSSLTDEAILRLNAAEQLVGQLLDALRGALWEGIHAFWKQRAELVAGACATCGGHCERAERAVRVTVSEQSLLVSSVYFYCRSCRRGNSPLAQWLGLHHGQVSAQFERHLVALSAQRSFHQAAAQMIEQHGQVVGAGKAERVTYSVARDALVYLEERHTQAGDAFHGTNIPVGVDKLLVTTDGGGAPVGVLHRPSKDSGRDPKQPPQKTTPKRNLLKGTRQQTHREMRVIIAHSLPHEHGEQRCIDVHLAPLERPEVSGDRMLAIARLAGMGTSTHVHGVFDGGTWIKPQFLRVFGDSPHSVCLDKPHAVEYISDAGKALFPDESQQDDRNLWLRDTKDHLQAGTWISIVQNLRFSEAEDVIAARTYVENHHEDMAYSRYEAEGLPIGSGEAEGAIRHQVRARFDNAGVWREEHLSPMGALLSIRESGWWEDFWLWRESRDVEAFRARQRGEQKRKFRGRAKPAASGTSSGVEEPAK
jgi:hypothetical protein